MNSGFWAEVLHWTLWGAVMALVMGWLARSRLRARPATEARHLVHPPSTLIMGIVGLTLFGGIAVLLAVLLIVIPPQAAASVPWFMWWLVAAFLAFALLFVPSVSGFFLERHEISERGIAFRSWMGVRKYLRWSDLCAVRYGPIMSCFRLRTGTGTAARVSLSLMGLPEFARLLLRNSPEGAIDPGTLKILQATAAGNPPPLWED